MIEKKNKTKKITGGGNKITLFPATGRSRAGHRNSDNKSKF